MNVLLRPELWIVAGPNGAGKTTCVQREPIASVLPSVKVFNPDDRTQEKLRQAGYAGFRDTPPAKLLQFFLESANEISFELELALLAGVPVCVETVLSTDKYRAIVEKVVQANGFFGLIYIALESSALACSRVASRVKEGGHDVPPDKIERRWEQSLERLPWFAQRASAFWILDNSNSELDHERPLIAHGQDGRLLVFHEELAFPKLRRAVCKI